MSVKLRELVACLAAAGSLSAQDRTPPPTESNRPGLLKAGPFYLTPRLRLGTIGLDTNVFYTATDRRTDFSASGGPGLEVILPMRAARLLLDGGLTYVYFLRTESQRRLGGDASARLEGGSRRLQAGLEGGFARSYQRPNFEVDRRVLQDLRGARGDVTVNPAGRLGLRTMISVQDVQVAGDQPFLGADLRRSLTRREEQALAGLRYRLTPKTALLAEVDHQQDRFSFDETRDTDSNRLYGGMEILSTTRLSGRAVGGVRLLRFVNLGERIAVPYADAALTWHFGPRTRLAAVGKYEVSQTAFVSVSDTPTLRTRTYGLQLDKGLPGRFDLQAHGTYSRLRTDGAVLVQRGLGPAIAVERDDDVRQAGLDLGYRFRARLRVGLAATHTDRRSNFADLGIDGLLLGGTVTFVP